MRRNVKLTERDLTRLVKRIVREEEEMDAPLDMKKPFETAGFTDVDIPEECKGNNPGMSQIDQIEACSSSITKKLTSLSSALTALTALMTTAKSKSSAMGGSSDVMESRRRYRNY